jgi:hypothetical protein
MGFGTRHEPGPKRALRHEVTDALAREVLGLGDPGNGVAVATIQREGDMHALAGPAANLDAVAAPAHVAARGHQLALVRPRDLPREACEEEPLALHRAVDPLVAYTQRRLAVEHRGDAPIAVASPLLDAANARNQIVVALGDALSARLTRRAMRRDA